MYPSSAFTLQQYWDELEVARRGGRGLVMLSDLPPTHPIHSSLPRDLFVQDVVRRAVEVGLTDRPVEVVVLTALDFVAQVVGLPTFQKLETLSLPALTSTALAAVYGSTLSMETQGVAPDRVCIRAIVYGFIIAHFVCGATPAKAQSFLYELMNVIPAPYNAHQNTLRSFQQITGGSEPVMH